MAGLLDKIKGMLGGAQSKAPDADTIKAKAGEAKAKVDELVDKAGDKVPTKVKDLYEKVSDKVDDLIPGGDDEDVTDAAGDAAGDTGEATPKVDAS